MSQEKVNWDILFKFLNKSDSIYYNRNLIEVRRLLFNTSVLHLTQRALPNILLGTRRLTTQGQSLHIQRQEVSFHLLFLCTLLFQSSPRETCCKNSCHLGFKHHTVLNNRAHHTPITSWVQCSVQRSGDVRGLFSAPMEVNLKILAVLLILAAWLCGWRR